MAEDLLSAEETSLPRLYLPTKQPGDSAKRLEIGLGRFEKPCVALDSLARQGREWLDDRLLRYHEMHLGAAAHLQGELD